jgi:hypothetical protein
MNWTSGGVVRDKEGSLLSAVAMEAGSSSRDKSAGDAAGLERGEDEQDWTSWLWAACEPPKAGAKRAVTGPFTVFLLVSFLFPKWNQF